MIWFLLFELRVPSATPLGPTSWQRVRALCSLRRQQHATHRRYASLGWREQVVTSGMMQRNTRRRGLWDNCYPKGTAKKFTRNMAPKAHQVARALAGATGLIQTMLFTLLALGMLLTASSAQSELVPGSMDVHWNEGAADCAKNPALWLQVHQYNSQTFILREDLCATFEAPFMYLLVGSAKALL